MGLFSWLFPSPETRLARARALVDEGHPAAALDEVAKLDGPEADGLRRVARAALAQINLDAAISWAEAGDPERVRVHLELAHDYLDGSDAPLRTASNVVRELFAKHEAAAAAAAKEKERRIFGDIGGVVPDFGDEDDARANRVALMVEGYPEALRPGLAGLGASFADAVLALDDNKPDVALLALLALPDDAAPVQYERGRCALALGDPAAAARAFQTAAIRAGGDFNGPNGHTAVLRAECLASTGRIPEAVTVLRHARAAEPDVGGLLYAHLLYGTRALPEAEQVIRDLIRKHPKESQLHLLLARVRRAGGHLVPAMRALEVALESSCEHPGGKCGTRPPDAAVVRLLAGSYLESGTDQARATELLDMLERLPPPPASWEDAWLDAWVARRSGAPDAVDRLRAALAAAPPEERARLPEIEAAARA